VNYRERESRSGEPALPLTVYLAFAKELEQYIPHRRKNSSKDNDFANHRQFQAEVFFVGQASACPGFSYKHLIRAQPGAAQKDRSGGALFGGERFPSRPERLNWRIHPVELAGRIAL
jgi:hypothetical protein